MATSQNFTASLTTAVNTTEEIPYGDHESGQIHIPTGSSITSLTFHATDVQRGKSGTYEACYDTSNSAVTMTVAAERCYPFPTDLVGARTLKIVTNANGDVRINLKRD